MTLFWILFLIHPSTQDRSHWRNHWRTSTLLPHITEQNFYQQELICENSTSCMTCVKNSFFSSALRPEASNDPDDPVYSFTTVPQVADAGCSLGEFYKSLPYWSNSTSEAISWYPGKRNVQYGPYEFTIWGPFFGKNISENLNISTENEQNIFSKNCLIYDTATRKYKPEYCQAKHIRRCYVSETELREFCFSSCVSCSDENSCYTSNSSCATESFSSEEADFDCPSSFKNTNKCLSLVNMVLSFNKYLYLTIYHPECLFGKGNPDYIYCFTNAADQLKKRVNLSNMFNSTTLNQPYKNNYSIYQLSLEEYIGLYWCEAKGPREDSSVYESNALIAYKSTKGHEFAVRLKINNICNYTDCNSINDLSFLIDDVRTPIEQINFGKVRIMKVIDFYDSSFVDIIVHVSTFSRRPGILGDYYKLVGLLKSYPKYIEVIYCRSSDRCLPQTCRNLTWPFARQFQRVLPSELCVQVNGSPVTRFCEGDFLQGLNWREIEGECNEDHDFSNETILLQSFLNERVSVEIIQNVSDIVHNGNLTLIDLYFVSQILESTTEIHMNDTLLNASLNIVNGLLRKDFNLLVLAQERLNLTDSYLRAGETMAVNLTGTRSELLTLQKDNILFYSFNPINENASGFVLYKNFTIQNIPLKGSFKDINDIDNIKLALYLPTEDIHTILTDNLDNVSIVAMIYLNDLLFPSNTSKRADLVLSLNIPNYENYLQRPIPLLVSSEGNGYYNCAFWDYGDLNQQKKGNWSLFGGSYDGMFNNHTNLQLCSYSHLTHLALLVVDKQNDTSVDGTNDNVLSVITAVGSLLSMFGICGIFLTSCLFRSWRDKTGTQILLHLSIATLLEIIFMYLNGAKLFTCVISGCILQYVIISKFSWMLVYAFCQYLRFVRVFGPLPHHFLLKSIIFGWGFGVIPTVPVLIANPDTYYREKFCYPNGYYLFLGLYLPVAITLVINFSVFCKIMYEITNRKFDKYRSSSLKTQHIKLAVLLFSVLGIPWIFGLLSNLVPIDWLKVIFVYIFTATSVVQGFLMFSFYVIFNKETRDSWKRLLFGQRKAYEMFSSTKKSNSVSSIT